MSQYYNNFLCCGHYLVPRYKRIVNNIFPKNPRYGLEMQYLTQLQNFASRKPEKVERSFNYMSERIARYLRHRNRPYVILGIKAMTRAMELCEEQLNLFVAQYLRTLVLVFEQNEDLELMEEAIVSFEHYCAIREKTPSYQRNYEFFIDRFTQLCYSNDSANQMKLRLFGLRGHAALISKTAFDERQNDIWKSMDQIIPSLIFNLNDENSSIEGGPSALAESTIQNLFNRVNIISIEDCVLPIIRYLDDHKKWSPVQYTRKVFSVVMNSILVHNSYSIIDLLFNHLETHVHDKEHNSIKTSIMRVLHDCMIFSALHRASGSTMFDSIYRLMKFLKDSFERERQKNRSTENEFRSLIIQMIADFLEYLIEFQMIEVIHFIINSFPKFYKSTENPNTQEIDCKFQIILLRMIRDVTSKRRSAGSNTKRKTEEMNQTTETDSLTRTAFPHRILDPLLAILTHPEPDIRLIVLEILEIYVDRRHYGDKFQTIEILKDVSVLNLPSNDENNGPAYVPFIYKFHNQFLSQLYRCLFLENNTPEIFCGIYCLMNLVTLESAEKDVVVDMIDFCLEIQAIIVEMMKNDPQQLIRISYDTIFGLIAAYFNFISKYYRISPLIDHVEKVLHYRGRHYPFLLPSNARVSRNEKNETIHLSYGCLFHRETIFQALQRYDYKTVQSNRRFQLTSESNVTKGDDELVDSDIELSIDDENLSDRSKKKNSSRSERKFRSAQEILNSTNPKDNRTSQYGIQLEEFRTKKFHDLKANLNDKERRKQERIEKIMTDPYLLSTTPEHSTIKIDRVNIPEGYLF